MRVENFDLTPAHACGPISHAWLKNVSCCRLAWHNFQKYVNSDPCKEWKPCVKWINDNTFLAISVFWSEKHWERARVYTRPETGTSKCEGCFRFRHRRTASEDFGLLWKTSDFFGNIRKWSCRFQKSQHSQDKNLTPIFQKKLAGMIYAPKQDGNKYPQLFYESSPSRHNAPTSLSLFPVDCNAHKLFFWLQSNVFNAASLFQTNQVVQCN